MVVAVNPPSGGKLSMQMANLPTRKSAPAIVQRDRTCGAISRISRKALVAVLFGSLSLQTLPAAAQDFYADKTLTIVVGSGEGVPAASAAQFYARHLSRFIPGQPQVVLNFKPGQGGNSAANFVAAEAPRDGTVVGIIGGRAIWAPILDFSKPPFDVRRLNWIGAKSQDNIVCIVSSESGIESLDDVRRKEVRIGITQPGTRSAVYAKLLNDLTATRFTPVPGFENVDAILKGMEGRKVDGHCGSTLESLRLRVPAWFEEVKIRVLVQFARNADDKFPRVPLAHLVPRTDTGKRVMVFLASDSFLGQAMMAPQDVPPESIEILRRAFTAMWDDEVVREEAVKERITVNPVTGAQLQDFVAQLNGAPQDVLWIVKSVIDAK